MGSGRDSHMNVQTGSPPNSKTHIPFAGHGTSEGNRLGLTSQVLADLFQRGSTLAPIASAGKRHSKATKPPAQPNAGKPWKSQIFQSSSAKLQKPPPKTIKLFFKALKDNEQKQIQTLLGQYPLLLLTPDEKSRLTPLCSAAYHGHHEIVNFFLLCGADPNAFSLTGDTPLLWATRRGYPQIMRVLLENGANVNLPSRNRKTPLHWGIESRKVDVVEMLLDHGANVNATDREWDTPLVYAIRVDSEKFVELLITHGADVNALNKSYRTALFQAIERYWIGTHFEMVKMLLFYGATVDSPDAKRSLFFSENVNNTTVRDMLLEYGIRSHIHYQDYGFISLPLNAATYFNNDITSLLAGGEDPNRQDLRGHTPLHWAVRNKDTNAIRLLLAHGADSNIQNHVGDTPLNWAIRDNNLFAATQLLAGGANPNTRDKAGNTPLHQVARTNRLNFVPLLILYEAALEARNENLESPLHYAFTSGMARLLIEYGAAPNAIDHKRNTPFDSCPRSRAILEENAGKSGGDLASRQDFLFDLFHGHTPKSFTADKRLKEIKACLEEGVDPNAVLLVESLRGMGILHMAVQENDPTRFNFCQQVILILLEHGANINLQLPDGSTPLILAATFGRTDWVQTLLAHGANPRLADEKGVTPLKAAFYGGPKNADTLRHLLRYNEMTKTEEMLEECSEYGWNLHELQLLLAGV